MSFDINTAVTGAAMTGLTTPTYTLSSDQPPSINARQSIVTALGGTQTGVRTHSPSDPFSLTPVKPVKALPPPRPNPVTGVVGPAGRNKTSVLFRKGTVPVVGQNPQVSDVRLEMNIIAGAEINDKPNVAALLSLVGGWVNREMINLYVAGTTGSI